MKVSLYVAHWLDVKHDHFAGFLVLRGFGQIAFALSHSFNCCKSQKFQQSSSTSSIQLHGLIPFWRRYTNVLRCTYRCNQGCSVLRSNTRNKTGFASKRVRSKDSETDTLSLYSRSSHLVLEHIYLTQVVHACRQRVVAALRKHGRVHDGSKTGLIMIDSGRTARPLLMSQFIKLLCNQRELP